MACNLDFLKTQRFLMSRPVKYQSGWVLETKTDSGIENMRGVLSDDLLYHSNKEELSWSSQVEEIHEEPTKNSWIDRYERELVLQAIRKAFEDIQEKQEPSVGTEIKTGIEDGFETKIEIESASNQACRVLEFGASSGYMLEALKKQYPRNFYISTDLFDDGLQRSYIRNPDIMHVQCDFTNAPFSAGSMDIVYALNVLEHISDDRGTIQESYRILRGGGTVHLLCQEGNGYMIILMKHYTINADTQKMNW